MITWLQCFSWVVLTSGRVTVAEEYIGTVFYCHGYNSSSSSQEYVQLLISRLASLDYIRNTAGGAAPIGARDQI